MEVVSDVDYHQYTDTDTKSSSPATADSAPEDLLYTPRTPLAQQLGQDGYDGAMYCCNIL